jgi:hypothetical protein
MIANLSFLIAILISITALILLLELNWRITIIALALQYLGIFLLVVLSWPLELAIVKLVAGWMASAVLGLTWANTTTNDQPTHTISTILFRLLAAILVVLVAVSVSPGLAFWLKDITVVQAYSSLILMILGLIQLGLSSRPIRIIIGLLTVLGGFDILYASLVTSVLVAGLLAVVNLGLALLGAFLITDQSAEKPL